MDERDLQPAVGRRLFWIPWEAGVDIGLIGSSTGALEVVLQLQIGQQISNRVPKL